MESLKEQVKKSILTKHPELNEEEIDICYDWALTDYVLRRYPSTNNRPPIEKLEIDFYVASWVSRRMDDILNRFGFVGLSSYKENGVSFVWSDSYIDPTLASQIMPTGSVPK